MTTYITIMHNTNTTQELVNFFKKNYPWKCCKCLSWVDKDPFEEDRRYETCDNCYHVICRNCHRSVPPPQPRP